MNLRFLFLFMILGVLVLVVLYSVLQIAIYYTRNAQLEEQQQDYVEEMSSKEQIITDLATENERLAQELKKLQKEDDSIDEEEQPPD